MSVALPPEWLCIDRYRDDESKRQRMIEKSGRDDIDLRVLKGDVWGSAKIQADWKDPDIIAFVIEEAQTKSFSEVGLVLGADGAAVQRAYELYKSKGLCGDKPKVHHARGVVHEYVNNDDDDEDDDE